MQTVWQQILLAYFSLWFSFFNGHMCKGCSASQWSSNSVINNLSDGRIWAFFFINFQKQTIGQSCWLYTVIGHGVWKCEQAGFEDLSQALFSSFTQLVLPFFMCTTECTMNAFEERVIREAVRCSQEEVMLSGFLHCLRAWPLKTLWY